ncbi:MAG TPA: hypothetical protein VKG67_03240 [Gallionellaceae bacterium]|nr:hypothetical protein [Gallionellaceae bacterium]
MNRFRWIAFRVVKNLGLPGVAGVVLASLATFGYIGIVLPGQSRLEQLTHDVAAEQAAQKTARSNPMEDTHSTEGRLRTFYEFFPVQQSAPQLLGVIYDAARKESIYLSEGEYKYSRAKAGKLGMYQVDLPVKGSYVQVRKFIVKVLNSVPSAALDEVSFKREAVGSTEIEAKIRFTLYLRVV